MRPLGLGWGKRKVDRPLFLGDFDPLHLFQFLDAALHLFGFGRRVAEAVDEDFQLLDALRWLRNAAWSCSRRCSSVPETFRSCRCRDEVVLFQISAILLTVTSRK